jgi:hypothetical protein
MAGVPLLGAAVPGALKPASMRGFIYTGCQRRIGMRLWHYLTRLLLPDAAETSPGTKAGLI